MFKWMPPRSRRWQIHCLHYLWLLLFGAFYAVKYSFILGASVCQWDESALNHSVLTWCRCVLYTLFCHLTNACFLLLLFGNKSSRSRLEIFLIRFDSLNEIIAHSHPVNSTYGILTPFKPWKVNQWFNREIVCGCICTGTLTWKKWHFTCVAFYNLQFIKSSQRYNLSDFECETKKFK